VFFIGTVYFYKEKPVIRLIFIALPLLCGFGPFDSPSRLVEEGNRRFEEGRYDEAMGPYERAAEIAKDKAPIDYNRGNLLLKKGDLEGALKSYRESAAHGSDPVKAGSFYNYGNAMFEAQRFEDALNAYREALKYDPADADAKANLELALKKVEEQKKQEKQEKGEESKDGSGDEKDQQDSKDGGDREDTSQGDKPKDSDDPEDEKKEDKGRDNEKQADKKMSREEAERLLDNMGDRNMDLQNRGDMVQGSDLGKVERDW